MGDPQHKMDQFSFQESLNKEKTSYSDVVTDSNTDMVMTLPLSPSMGGSREQSIVQAMKSSVEKEEEENIDSKKADLERQPLYIHYQNSPDEILSISSGSDWSPATPDENIDHGEHRIDSLRMSANLRDISE